MGPQSPLYLQLRELIRSKIENGEYPPGTAIPSVGTLAEKYGIHRLSVRSAISALIGEGLLKSVQGKGILWWEKSWSRIWRLWAALNKR